MNSREYVSRSLMLNKVCYYSVNVMLKNANYNSKCTIEAINCF